MFNEFKQLITVNDKSEFYKTASDIKNDTHYDVTIIIPVRGRGQFFKSIINHLRGAINRTEKNINIVFIEHSDFSIHGKRCEEFKVNHYWVKANRNEPFNKCLAHNIGALLYQNSDYYMFHDLDCIMFDDFFLNLFDNIKNKESKAIQTFQKRRVLYLDDVLTKGIMKGITRLNSIALDSTRIKIGNQGAPGGSILIDKDLFFNVGGYDPELFVGNSPEDAYFWDKVSTLNDIHSCDQPINELLHLSHVIGKHSDPLYTNRYKSLSELNPKKFRELIKHKKDILTKFKH